MAYWSPSPPARVDVDQSVRMLDRQRPEQQRVDEREDGGVEPDADRERRDRHERKAGAPAEPSQRVSDIRADRIETGRPPHYRTTKRGETFSGRKIASVARPPPPLAAQTQRATASSPKRRRRARLRQRQPGRGRRGLFVGTPRAAERFAETVEGPERFRAAAAAGLPRFVPAAASRQSPRTVRRATRARPRERCGTTAPRWRERGYADFLLFRAR